MNIVQVTQVTDEIAAAFERLIPQLSPSGLSPGREELAGIAASPATTLLVARDPNQDDAIVGTLTLVLYRIPTGLHAWIEDVVVDEAARGQGVGEALCRAALAYAKTAGAYSVDLTSRPSREAANRLYQRMGFQKRDTNVYRYTYARG